MENRPGSVVVAVERRRGEDARDEDVWLTATAGELVPHTEAR